MSRIAKTLSHIGAYFMLSSLIPVMILSLFMMATKKITSGSLGESELIGGWLKEISDDVLNQLVTIGIGVFVGSLVFFGVITFFMVFINTRKAYKQRIGYIIGLIIGILLIIITVLPLIIIPSDSLGGLGQLVSGILFIFGGLSGLFIAVGSILGIISAKTYKTPELEIKEENYVHNKVFDEEELGIKPKNRNPINV